MAWVKPFAAFKRNVSVAYAWEPVIVSFDHTGICQCKDPSCPIRAAEAHVRRIVSLPTNPPPTPGTAPHTVDLVRADLVKRKAMGIAKYGVPHQADNGRDHLLDAYEEALDLAIYLRAEIERRKAVTP